MVAAGRVRVGAEVGENRVNIDHVTGGPVGIVDAGQGNAEGLMIRREVHHATVADRPAVDAVNRSDGADLPAGIHADLRRRADGRVRQRSQQEHPGEEDRWERFTGLRYWRFHGCPLKMGRALGT